MDERRKYGYGFVALLVLFFVWRYITNPLVITVTGSGKVVVPATTARVTATVVDTADTAESVEISLKTKISSVRLAMVNGGVKEESLSQSQIQITPLAAVVSGAKGFSATVSIVGQSSDVANINTLLVKVYQAGASLVSQPVIEVNNEQQLENDALKMALKEADANAKYLAKLNWKLIKRVASVQQASSGNTSTTTKVAEKDGVLSSSFEVAKAVSVVYYLW